MSKKLVLIDGHSILNRAFFGVPDLTNAKGLHTNAIYGFLNILFKILDEEKPDYLAVAFDVKAPTFRHELFAEYKGTRKPMAEELREQVPVMKEVLAAMGVVCVEHAGWEADDIMGTLAKKAEADGIEVSLVSGDRDLLQIASKHIKIRIPKTKMGRTEIEDYYEDDVLEKYQVTPVQFIELKALMGDTADNIPGVPKVGEKTATALMVEYGSIENIYANIENITKKSIKESLKENKHLAELSKTLATIKTDCDIVLDYESARAEGYFTQEAYQLFKMLEFKNMLSRFESNMAEKQAANISEGFHIVEKKSDFASLCRRVKKGTKVGLELVVENGQLLGAVLAMSEKELYYFYQEQAPVKKENEQLSLFDTSPEPAMDRELEEALWALSENARIYTLNIKDKYDYLCYDNLENYFDVVLGAYLCNPLKNDYDAEAIATEYLGISIPGYKEFFGKLTISQAAADKSAELAYFYLYQAYTAYAAGDKIIEKLKEQGMYPLMQDMEMPLTYVLYDMEKEGVLVKREELKNYGEALVSRITELEKSIHESAGAEFNINSPKQLGEVLFEKMGIPGGKKTKTGYSTAADVLEKLAPEYPIVNDILEYRTLTKLKSTYAEGLSGCIREDGRIHTTFNQTITATGRISSTEPNLQNIPMRMELGKQIRKVFVPKEGCLLMDADYSQIELRVLAHLSGDEELISAYRSEQDIHRITASKVFKIPFEEVTELQRRNAKAVNFGIVYGISSFGLSQDLSISRKEAAGYIEQYFATYPRLKQYLDDLVENAKKDGYTATLFGRRRPIPELSSSNFMQRSFGERVAMNAPIQGTAADIIKLAMIKVWKALREAGLKSKLILQVHDELLIEVWEEEVAQVKEILANNMRQAADLAVDLAVDLHVGKDWYDAH